MTRTIGLLLVVLAFLVAGCDSSDAEPAATSTTVTAAPSTSSTTTIAATTTTTRPTEMLTGHLQFEVPSAVVRLDPGCDTGGEWREFIYVGMPVEVYSSDGTLLGDSQLQVGELKANESCYLPFAVEVPADAPDYDLCLVGSGPSGPIPLDEMRDDFEWELVMATGHNASPPTEAQPCSLFWDS